jgi:tetratricopeptide (TPR) repeat protein
MNCLLRTIPLLFLLCSLLSAGNREGLQEGLPGNSLGATWRDPDFVRSFIGSYGFLSGLEPNIAANERELLQTILETIQRDPLQAIRQLEQNRSNDGSAAFDFILGNLLFQNERWQQAAASYRTAIRKFPDFRRAHKNLGLLELRQANYGTAIDSLTRALELGDVDGRSYGLLGYAHLQMQQPFPAAIAYRQATLIQPKVSDWQIGLVQSLMQTGRAAEAIALMDHLLNQQPARTDIWLLKANAWLSENNPTQAALAIEMAHRFGDKRERSHLLLGDIYFRDNLPELALEHYMAALNLSQEQPSNALLRAVDLFQRRRDDIQANALMDALFASNEALSRSQRHDLLQLQARRARNENNLEQARKLLETLIAESALNGAAIIELGDIHQQLGDIESAINRYEQARLIAASERDALIALARLWVQENALDRAIPLLRNALKIHYDTALENYLERLQSAHSSKID